MSTYLLTCQCGKTISVEAGQAGEQVACECGASVEVPPLRKLRHLPLAQPEAGQPRAAWSARKGFVAAALIASGLLAVAAAWARWTEPVVPAFNPQAQLSVVDTELAKITPTEGWLRWVAYYRPLATRGFSDLQFPFAAAIEQKIAERRALQKTLLTIAAVCSGVAVIAMFWPAGTTSTRSR